MAIQSTIYNTDGTTRTFPSTKPIGTILHVGVYLKQVLDSAWVPMNVSDYTLVQNAIITDVAPDTLLYSQIEIRVADDPAEITANPSDTAIVAGDTIAINAVATNIPSVVIVSTNMGAVTNVSANMTEVLLADTNAATATAQAGIATTQAGIATTQAGIATTQAGIATTQAGLSIDSATESEHWANYTTDVAVPEGVGEFSAKHYATKAAQSLAGLTVDAVPTDGSTNAVSSNGVFDALALKVDDSEMASYLLKAGGDMTGTIRGVYQAIGANDIAVSTADVFSKTISGATTLTVSSIPASPKLAIFVLELTNGGSAVVTWFANIRWDGGTAPTLTVSGTDIIVFYTRDGGTNWRALVRKDSK